MAAFGSCLRRICLAVLLSASSVHAASSSYAGWPQSWVDAYERFQRFITAKDQYFPGSDLKFGEDGKSVHSVRWPSSTTERIEIEIYKNGLEVWGLSKSQGLEPDTLRMFPTGHRFTAVMKSCGGLGYQFLYPFAWFETVDAAKKPGAQPVRQVRMIPAPVPAEDYWPNERISRFRDFHVLPHNNPKDILAKNDKVTPSISLRVDNNGQILRNILPPELEKLLTWRIYRDNKLIHKGPAANQAARQAGDKPGEYHVMVGIDGPKGFMPVSNLLRFPLFPQGKSELVIMPETNKTPGVPDFLSELLNENQLNTLREEESREGKRYQDSSAYRSFDMKTTEDRFLVELWMMWAWTLDQWQPGKETFFFPSYSPKGTTAGEKPPAAGSR